MVGRSLKVAASASHVEALSLDCHGSVRQCEVTEKATLRSERLCHAILQCNAYLSRAVDSNHRPNKNHTLVATVANTGHCRCLDTFAPTRRLFRLTMHAHNTCNVCIHRDAMAFSVTKLPYKTNQKASWRLQQVKV